MIFIEPRLAILVLLYMEITTMTHDTQIKIGAYYNVLRISQFSDSDDKRLKEAVEAAKNGDLTYYKAIVSASEMFIDSVCNIEKEILSDLL